jgi:ubiquinone/menaquinone biosynthesis C-methylase UbiE
MFQIPLDMKRSPSAELLDADAGTPAQVERSLRDLKFVNRWFGGIACGIALVRKVAAASATTRLSLLEVAAGSSEVPERIAAALKRRKIELEVTLLDRSLSHLTLNTPSIAGDALALPFRDSTFDIVSSTLFTHHLSPSELAQFVNEGLRVCRKAVIINDLVRSPSHLLLVYAGFLLYSSPLTRHDAPASVRQAYTPDEMRNILAQTSAKRIELSRHYLYRMGAIAWKA